jgi:hypothetical protein
MAEAPNPDGAAERWAELPESTRHFIEDLRPDEIETMREGIRLVQSFRTVGVFVRWSFYVLFGTFIAFVGFGEAVTRFRGWFK